MKKSIMKKLVAALRSGEYEQGMGRLVTVEGSGDEKFCCLGVLCNIATESGYGEWQGSQFRDENGSWCSGLPPKGVADWAGMRMSNGGILNSNLDSLVTMNDDGKTFAEIADHIEANYKSL